MALETVEGTLDPGQPKRVKRGYALFPELTLTTPTGERRSFVKVATGEPVTAHVLKGGPGHYSFTRTGGALALVGVRRPDGESAFGWFTNVMTMLLVVGTLGTLFGIVRFALASQEMPVTPGVLGPILLGLGFYMRHQKEAARRAFEASA